MVGKDVVVKQALRAYRIAAEGLTPVHKLVEAQQPTSQHVAIVIDGTQQFAAVVGEGLRGNRRDGIAPIRGGR